jgi:gluconate 2-dehydrogenase gamma chain
MVQQTLSRRRFLQVLGALGVSQVFPVEFHAQIAPKLPLTPQYQSPERPRGLSTLRGAYTFFTVPEARFIESAVDRLIPSDELGPGALEAGVPYFIDQQLQGKFGLAATWYMQGPWGAGTAGQRGESGQPADAQTAIDTAEEQGYQLPLTPQELYRLCIAALDMHTEDGQGVVFADLEGAQQDGLLSALENGELSIEPLPSSLLSAFWTLLLDNTMQGYFADPAYGGNQNKVGWRLVGFPGVAAAYRGVMEAYYGQLYQVEPVSIADIQNGLVETDGGGHALHRDPVTGRVITEVMHDHEH